MIWTILSHELIVWKMKRLQMMLCCVLFVCSVYVYSKGLERFFFSWSKQGLEMSWRISFWGRFQSYRFFVCDFHPRSLEANMGFFWY